jgi:hypothetical protein
MRGGFCILKLRKSPAEIRRNKALRRPSAGEFERLPMGCQQLSPVIIKTLRSSIAPNNARAL